MNITCINCEQNKKNVQNNYSKAKHVEPDKPWAYTPKELSTEIGQGRGTAGHLKPLRWLQQQQQQGLETGYCVTGSGHCWVSNIIAESSVSAHHWLTLKDLLEFPTVPPTRPAIAEGPHSGCGLNLSQNVLLGEDSPADAGTAFFSSCPSFPFGEMAVYMDYCNPYNSMVF